MSLTTSLGLLAWACITALAQSATNAEARSRVIGMLEKPLSDPPANGSIHLTVVVQDMLFRAGTYGGIVDVDRCAEHKIDYQRAGGETTLKEALNAVVAAAPKYRWTVSEEGAINVLPAGPLPQSLETEIPYFGWDVNKPMVTALADLKDTHEVRKHRLELNITQIGYERLSLLPLEPPIEKRRDWWRVEHVSLFSALNAIVRSYGYGVWVYSECRPTDAITIGLTNTAR